MNDSPCAEGQVVLTTELSVHSVQDLNLTSQFRDSMDGMTSSCVVLFACRDMKAALQASTVFQNPLA